jgi:hypothetical protein
MPTGAEHFREEIPQPTLDHLLFRKTMTISQLLEAFRFLEKVSDFNEATEYDPADEPLIEMLIGLAGQRNKKAIAEEFKTPFLHPMVTIQQHVEEFKELVRQELLHRQVNDD